MRVHVTDQLFGLEAFSRPLEPTAGHGADPPATGADLPATGADPPATGATRTDVGDPPVESPAQAEEDGTGELAAPLVTARSLVRRGAVLGLLFFILASVVGLSLFTLSMKTRKKAASYELAHQTRLFRRMSKHRAIYELEYAYHRSNSPIQEEFTRQGWREITPHDLTYIPVKKSAPRGRQESTW